MSDVKVIRYLLANNTALTNVVAATKIMPGVIPQGTTLPAIAVSHISTVRAKEVAKGATEYCTSRVQITVQTKDYPTQKSILALVRAALPRTRGTINGVSVDRVMHEIDGPDWRDDDAGIFMGSVDYIVGFNE